MPVPVLKFINDLFLPELKFVKIISSYLRRVYFTTVFFRLKTKKEVSKWAIARPCLKKGVPGFELVFKTLV